MRLLIGIGFAGLLFLAIWALSQDQGGLKVFTWSMIAAFAATNMGGALGLLFGLPTAQVSSVVPSADNDLGYRESTSLEQVADWLTKILIGLTLTQFTSWEQKFTNLSRNLTEVLIGPSPVSPACALSEIVRALRAAAMSSEANCAAPVSAVPGGTLLALYAVLGFLIAYLWMRRYFIHELVSAKEEAKERLKQSIRIITAEGAAQAEGARKEIEEAVRHAERAATLAEVESAKVKGLAPVIGNPAKPTTTTSSDIQGVLEKAKLLVRADSAGAAALTNMIGGIDNPPPDAEDPWRGKFGGQAQRNNVILEAQVSTTADPLTFRIDLVAHGQTPERSAALAGCKAIYFLHPTFGLDPRVATFGTDGRAPLELFAWGAFTVGVLLEDGTQLELNLATLDGVPDAFRLR